jgi:DNA polymerase-1
VLATLADELAHERDVVIASGDRDMLQLVNARVKVLFHGQRGKPAQRYDEAAVQKRFGIGAERLPLYVALLGDVSDNIPKVKGIGPRAAQALAARFCDVDALLLGLPELDNARTRELLGSHREQLRASEQLVRLRRDVPLPEGARYGGLTSATVDETRALFAELEFKSLIPRLEALLK